MCNQEQMTVDEFSEYVDTLDQRGMDNLLAYAYGIDPVLITRAIRLQQRVTAERAAKAEPPVIPPAERDCPAQNPETAFWCHKSGPHKTHRDSNGDMWTDAEPAAAPERETAGTVAL